MEKYAYKKSAVAADLEQDLFRLAGKRAIDEGLEDDAIIAALAAALGDMIKVSVHAFEGTEEEKRALIEIMTGLAVKNMQHRIENFLPDTHAPVIN